MVCRPHIDHEFYFLASLGGPQTRLPIFCPQVISNPTPVDLAQVHVILGAGVNARVKQQQGQVGEGGVVHKDSEGVQKNRCGEAGDKGMSQVSLGLNRHCARPSSDFLSVK